MVKTYVIAKFSERQEEHLRSLEAYNEKIETAYKSVRSFKHDYENILISMQTSIDSGDFDLIEQTYQDILKRLVKNSLRKMTKLSLECKQEILS